MDGLLQQRLEGGAVGETYTYKLVDGLLQQRLEGDAVGGTSTYKLVDGLIQQRLVGDAVGGRPNGDTSLKEQCNGIPACLAWPGQASSAGELSSCRRSGMRTTTCRPWATASPRSLRAWPRTSHLREGVSFRWNLTSTWTTLPPYPPDCT